MIDGIRYACPPYRTCRCLTSLSSYLQLYMCRQTDRTCSFFYGSYSIWDDSTDRLATYRLGLSSQQQKGQLYIVSGYILSFQRRRYQLCCIYIASRIGATLRIIDGLTSVQQAIVESLIGTDGLLDSLARSDIPPPDDIKCSQQLQIPNLRCPSVPPYDQRRLLENSRLIFLGKRTEIRLSSYITNISNRPTYIRLSTVSHGSSSSFFPCYFHRHLPRGTGSLEIYSFHSPL